MCSAVQSYSSGRMPLAFKGVIKDNSGNPSSICFSSVCPAHLHKELVVTLAPNSRAGNPFRLAFLTDFCPMTLHDCTLTTCIVGCPVPTSLHSSENCMGVLAKVN